MRLIETATTAIRDQWREALTKPIYWQGQALVTLSKTAEVQSTIGLTGKLYLTAGNWLMLSVPNALARGAFDALDEEGVELPKDDNGVFNAHISVMRPEEVEKIGGGGRISERGHAYAYQLGAVKTCRPETWEGVSRCWFMEVNSPMLQRLRASYGLPLLPEKAGKSIPFHATFAVRKVHVLRENDVSKG